MRYKILVIVIFMILLNGLNNSRELNDLAIVSAIGIEKEEDEFKVSAIILNPSKSEGKGNSSSEKLVIYESKSQTLQEAFRKMILESPRKLYIAHMKLLLVSEDVAKENFVDTLDFFVRDNEGSNKFLIAIAKDKSPKEFLEFQSPTEEAPTDDIVKSLKETSRYIASSKDVVLNDVIKRIVSDSEEVVLPTIIMEDKEEKQEKSDDEGSGQEEVEKTENTNGKDNENSDTQSKDDSTSEEDLKDKKIVVDTLGYFKGEKLQGYLDADDTVTYNLLRNKLKTTVLEIGNDENKKQDKLAVEIISSKAKLKPKYENGKYIVDIKVSGMFNITEISKNAECINTNNVDYYKKLVDDKVYNYITELYKRCKYDYKVDLIGFKDLYKKHLNSEYKKISDRFEEEIFDNIEINVKVDYI